MQSRCGVPPGTLSGAVSIDRSSPLDPPLPSRFLPFPLAGIGEGGAARNEQGPPADAPLGNTTKSSAAFDPRAARAERFALQSAVREILPSSRTAACFRHRRAGANVSVWKSIEHGKAHYKGLQVCGSVWTCPVCAAKISEKRRAELQAAMTVHQAAGGIVLLLTLTNPHSAADDLGELLAKQTKAIDHVLRGSRASKALMGQIGLVGTVRAWETTYGSNGFHPHFHVLLFLDGKSRLPAPHEFYELWANGCRLAGLPAPSFRHGVSLQDGRQAAQYVSKWGLDREMTKGHIKKAHSGYSPFDLLRAYSFGDHPEGVKVKLSERKAASLFAIYAAAFKGKRQLVWSKGLKAHFAIEDSSDESISTSSDAESILLGQIPLSDWKRIVASEARGVVLDLAETRGWSAVLAYLVELKSARIQRLLRTHCRGGGKS